MSVIQHVALEVREQDVAACVRFWALLGFEQVDPPAALAARAHARETPSVAFAPSFALFGVPSRSRSIRSIPDWSDASSPMSSGAMTSSTLPTATCTPLPR